MVFLVKILSGLQTPKLIVKNVRCGVGPRITELCPLLTGSVPWVTRSTDLLVSSFLHLFLGRSDLISYVPVIRDSRINFPMGVGDRIHKLLVNGSFM